MLMILYTDINGYIIGAEHGLPLKIEMAVNGSARLLTLNVGLTTDLCNSKGIQQVCIAKMQKVSPE